jgi:hypothetical protein
VCSLFGSLVKAQDSPPKPSAETKKLGMSVGKWTSTNTFSNGTPMTQTKICRWVAGGFAVFCETETKVGNATFHSATLTSYEEISHQYTSLQTGNNGSGYMIGTLEGNTWTWTSEATKADGTKSYHRFTQKFTSADSTEEKGEQGASKDSMKVFITGKSTRMK